MLLSLTKVMSSVKRQANSPAEKIPETKKQPSSYPTSYPQPIVMPTKNKQPSDQSKGSLIKFEVVAINEATFYGSLSELEIIYIWEKVLGRSRDEIFAMSYSRSLTRNFKVTIKLTTNLDASSIYPESNTFVFHRRKPNAVSEDDFDVLTCKFVGYTSVKPAEIGQLTRVTVKTNDFAVEPSEIVAWLAKFGSVSNVVGDFEKNSLGIRTDVFETEILLLKHIPEYLPIAGRKLIVAYPGIPRACNNCYMLGHMKRNCKQKKKSWLERVAELRASGNYEDSMFGGWIALLEQNSL